MSPAISLVKPLARPIRPCPYCDHVSPPDSKFCSACGAALHLVPCPHCGAVNDITATAACYRCHGELQPPADTAAVPALPVEPEPDTVTAEPVGASADRQARPHGLVVLIVLLAFAAASYYAFRQRGSMETRDSAAANAEATGRVSPAVSPSQPTPTPTPTPIVPAAIEKPPAPASQPVLPAAGNAAATGARIVTVDSPAAAPAAPIASPGKAVNSGDTAEPAITTATPPEISRPRPAASKGLDMPPPNIGPCTDAVAALGLCTPDTPPKRP